jgi:hypothetical protein
MISSKVATSIEEVLNASVKNEYCLERAAV